MREVARIGFGAAFTGAVCVSLGRMCLARLGMPLGPLERLFFSFALGAPILSLLLFLLTACHLAYTSVFAIVGIAIVSASLRERQIGRNGPAVHKLSWWVWGVFGCVYAAFALLYLLSALEPEVSPDGVAYHIPLIAGYLREHHFPIVANDMYASFPQGIEMLFLFAFSFGRHSAAAMTHSLFLIALPLGIVAFGNRVGRPLASVIGSLLFFLSPIVGRDGTAAYNDVALALTAFALFYLLWIWRSDRNDRLLLPIGTLAGFCYSIKYTGGLAIIYALGFVIWECRSQLRSFARPVALLTPGMALLIAPWIIKNAILVDNPIAPFGNRAFPNRYMTASAEDDYRHTMRTVSGLRARDLPLEIAWRGGRLNGIVGPVFLLSPLALFSLMDPLGRRLLLAAAMFALPLFVNASTRFVIPALPFLSLGIALVLARWRTLSLAMVIAHAIVSWPTLVQRYTEAASWNLEVPSLISAFRIYPEAEYVNGWLPDFQIGQLIEKNVARSESVFALSPIQRSYIRRNVVIAGNSAFGDRLREVLLSPVLPEKQPGAKYRFRFAPAMCAAFRVIQTGRSQEESWTISEIKFYRGATEIPRTTIEAVSANSNPWDIPLAFDNNPATPWISGGRIAPGIAVSVRFAQPQVIDEIALLSPGDRPASSMQVELLRSGGAWAPVTQPAEHGQAAIPPWLRRASMEFFKANGIRWIVANDSDSGARDLSRKQTLWSIQMVAADKTYKLYRIE